MRRTGGLLAGLLFISGAVWSADNKPNVLLIYTDDHGWADLGAQGVDADIRTPNLDRLAAAGVRFTRGYVTAPQCTPSRAGVITGVYQNRFGVEHNNLAMKQEVVTLPERLKQAGYVTGISGKWHLDIEEERKENRRKTKLNPDLLPHKQGFDEYFTGTLHDYLASHAPDGTPFTDAPHAVRDERCRVVIQTDAALSFLDRRAKKPEQPWFLYLAYMAPHVPLESAEPWFSQTPATLPLIRRQALSLLGAIDDGIGRVRAKLKEMGQAENTLILFIGDNGAPLGKVWDGSINLPLKGQKGMLSEGGIRTPFVAAWPSHIPPGRVYDKPVISLDVAATAVSLAGLPQDPALDGVNLIPFLTGANPGAPHETLYWRWMSQAAIQEYPYKLIVLGDRERLLFDVTTPEGEALARNLVKQKPELAARLEAKLKAWCGTLQPPGLPTTFDQHHEGLFSEHDIIERKEAPPTAAPAGTVQGWLARNGSLAVKGGALVLLPDGKALPNARPFITNSGLDIPGPVTATLRIRSKRGGTSSVTWRTKQQPDFLPAHATTFDWPATAEWREVGVELPVAGRLIHVRITPAVGSEGLEIQSVELRGKADKAQRWRFGEAK